MKKYRVHWSIFNLTSSTQEEVVKLQMVWAGLATVITGSTFVMSDDRHTLAAAILSFVVDKIVLGCLYLEPKDEK
jgi:hypothetical protein